MQNGDYGTPPYFQYPNLQNLTLNPSPNPVSPPSDRNQSAYASAPPFSTNYGGSDYPGYATNYPPYSQNPDPVPASPTAPLYNPQSSNPNLQTFNPTSQPPAFPPFESHVPYQSPSQPQSYNSTYDHHQTAPNYVPPPPSSITTNQGSNSTPSPNSHFSSVYSAPFGSLAQPAYENPYESSVKFDRGSTIGSSLTANWKALPVVCDGKPSVQTKSSTLKANGGCPDVYTNAGVSCTCLEGYDNSTEWEFYIQPRSELTDQPLTLEFGATLGLTSLVTIVAPDDLTSITIVGVGEDVVTLNVTAEATGWDDYDTSNPSLIEVGTTSALEKITLENVDLFTALDASTDYIPLAIENLTLRYTNISQVTPTFLQGFASLEYLDLSHNKLFGTYSRISSQMCTANPCPLKSINVSNNALTQIPYRMFYLNQLNSLYLENNAIENWTVSSDLYESIAGLTNFNMDPPSDTYACDNGTWLTAHGIDFCVLNSTTASTASDSSSSSNSYLIYVIVAACIVVCVLIFVFIRQRRAHNRRKERDESVFDHTLSFDSHFTANTNIINDPLIIAHRIPFKDVKVANCINKGGFGLVYSGVYNRRRVAIKRIRTDLCQDMKHVEAFMKEICLISTLEHPRIVEFIGVAWDTLRNLSAVTEYMERGDLREVLHSFQLRNTPVTWDAHKLRITQHIAEALTYLHSLDPKLIHRDLKSKNVLLNTEMEAKLSDFGVSRERHAMETHMTAGIGTSFWIAPEVLLGKDYDERADIFSLGIVISEIDTEDYPYWNAKNPPQGGKVEETAILRMVAAGELIPDFTEGCPKAVLELAKACLSLNPDDRPSATEVVYAIQQIMSHSSVSYAGGVSMDSFSSNSSRPMSM